MSWRVVVIHNTAKLDLQLNYLVVRGELNTTKIHISEIAVLLVESTSVSLTVGLLAELSKQKVKVVFCDSQRNPSSELVSYYGSHDTSNKVRTQISWQNAAKEAVWTEIVREKIKQQQKFLSERGKEKEAILLSEYIQDIQWNDETNREGHAAKVYFNALFGMDFSRSQDNNINAALNYGYAILLSAFNREIVANGYFTQLGLFHDNMFNQFNLGSDLMEPFRVLVDKTVCTMKLDEFEHPEKMKLVNILNQEVIMEGKHYIVLNAIKRYVKSVFDALNDSDVSLLTFYKGYEL
ncbi:MAG: type II CRISPR-associated endonuclease Cas1 [Lachnospiraceae bacterium]|nr:type II CRISPR-associated endonuclease Cas1 [Lachnospiraceae bacterium]